MDRTKSLLDLLIPCVSEKRFDCEQWKRNDQIQKNSVLQYNAVSK